jgi:hypothetical protein
MSYKDLMNLKCLKPNRFLTIVPLLFCCFNGYGQYISCPKFNINYPSTYDSITTERINNFLNNQLHNVVLLRIKPHLKTETNFDLFSPSVKLTKTQIEVFSTIIQGDSLESNMIEKFKTANDSDLNKIIRIIFSRENKTTSCRCGYEPQNGILFYDANGTYLGYIELYFKYFGYRQSSPLLSPTKINAEEFNELKTIFQKNGIDIN